jgi:hypothetical protein
LLHAGRLGFSALRAEPRLRRRALRTDESKHNQNEKRLARLHELPRRQPENPTRIRAAQYPWRIKSSAFFRERGLPKRLVRLS